ncbi:MAG: YicC family protein [Rhodocyclaceae bacterium]|nr:YicC family protein [Rhodocyclaceae bacterium]
MIQSMTGYAARSRELPQVSLHVELKSVNARYLDIHFRIGEELRFLELPLRELIASRVTRGKVECRAQLQANAGGNRDLSLNAPLLARLKELQGAVCAELPEAPPLTVSDVLRWPGMIGDSGVDNDTLQRECLELANLALDDFVATRRREGDKLAAMLFERTAKIRDLVARAQPLLPQAIDGYRERLAVKLKEAVANLDEERIRQEVGVFAAKIDVAEELNRLVAHLSEVDRVVSKADKAGIGKRLDFLMQELNREANTLASKSVSIEITEIALEMKLLIEQMREQIQNIE